MELRWKIGNVEIENPFVLAPMAGVTDLAFRRLCKEQGAGLICSCCRHALDTLELSDRTYVCPACGNTMDRDENAAVNICEEGKRIFPDYLKKILQEEQEASDKAKRKGRQKAA